MRNIEEAWSAYFKANATVDIESMNAEGWRTGKQIADIMGKTTDSVSSMLAKRGDVECKKCRVVLDGTTRAINFYRPK